MQALNKEPKMFEELRKEFGSEVTSHQLHSKGLIHLKKNMIQLSRCRFRIPDEVGVPTEVVRDVTANKEQIRKRFKMLSVLGEGVIEGNIRSLIVTGSAGVGKTYELERRLEKALATKRVSSYESLKGSISAIGLYRQLYLSRNKGDVLMLDDIDAVFGDDESLNLLKAALDTSVRRVVSWNKASRFLQDEDIPNSFEYEGQIIFITNVDMDKQIDKCNRLAPHMSALISRSIFLDLKIHEPKTIMVRVEQVLEESEMKDNLKISDSEAAEIVEWMHDNIDKLRSVSLRTVIQLASFVKTTKDWREMAECTLLKM